jgi:hypothetical protein
MPTLGTSTCAVVGDAAVFVGLGQLAVSRWAVDCNLPRSSFVTRRDSEADKNVPYFLVYFNLISWHAIKKPPLLILGLLDEPTVSALQMGTVH